MILTPIASHDLPGLLDRFSAVLADQPYALAIFRRIASTAPATGDSTPNPARDHGDALKLCHEFGLETIDEDPREAFSWDGRAVRVISEPSVIIHEVAHFQVAAPSRRPLYDFGLGAGPESGRRGDADAVQQLHGVERDIEEGLASLLGILWEAELGHPAILAYLEQNWMEGGDRRENREHFLKMVEMLRAMHLLDAEGRPTRNLRISEDNEFFAGLTRWRCD